MVKRGEEVIYPDSSTILQEDDNLIIAGENSKIDNISNKLSENVDFRNAFTDAYGEK
jgi:Trk K+ transport system NAD-binding subunit